MAEKIAAFSGLERTLSVRGKVTYATGEEYALVSIRWHGYSGTG